MFATSTDVCLESFQQQGLAEVFYCATLLEISLFYILPSRHNLDVAKQWLKKSDLPEADPDVWPNSEIGPGPCRPPDLLLYLHKTSRKQLSINRTQNFKFPPKKTACKIPSRSLYGRHIFKSWQMIQLHEPGPRATVFSFQLCQSAAHRRS